MNKQQLIEKLSLERHIEGGYWKATELETGKFSLVREAVSPGFEYEDTELAENNLTTVMFLM